MCCIFKSSKPMDIALDIHFLEKDEFKAAGGRWDRDNKTWYIPDGAGLTRFEKWLSSFGTIVGRPCYVAVSSRSCWKCGADTPLISLASERILERYDESETWESPDENNLVLFFNVSKLPGAVLRPLQQRYPFFQKKYSATARQYYFGNTCIGCGALQGDFFNHCEPDGAFFLLSEEDAEQVRLVELPLPHDFAIEADCNADEFIAAYSHREPYKGRSVR